ncbi:serine-rich adhesin for platelets [Anopheles nili]|uniref:serine-rich adhesin for platelets n=1 Tax=Anopheles nili TaxID=185578 RepID=UPI00237AB908|nr:serine-rich adhesin for platelets [Anopheles nili]
MNCGENDPVEIDARIQRDEPVGQEQQVVSIIAEGALVTCASKQPVRSNNHQFLQHLQQESLVTNDNAGEEENEWTTVHANVVGRNNADTIGTPRIIPPDGTGTGYDENTQHHNQQNDVPTAYLLADHHAGNGEFPRTRTEPESNGNGTEREREETIRQSQRLTMRDPQESHHRSAPAPLGEVESGEDSDCVVVPSTERKVEPLKINLVRDREPIRTIIKLTPGASSTADHFQQLSPTIRDVPGSPKITIKPPKPPQPSVETCPAVAGSSSAAAASTSSWAEQHLTGNCVVSASGMPLYSSIPKLTIKPVINPADDAPANDASVPGLAAVANEQMHIIPKLLIKGSSLDASHGREGAMEPHIVPKLTIRGVNNHNHHHHYQQQQQQHHFPQNQPELQSYSNDGTVASDDVLEGLPSNASIGGRSDAGTGSPTPLVPKLTIKMDNHHPHHHHLHHHPNSLRVKDPPEAGGDGVAPGQIVGVLPIPKLHIKTIQHGQDGVSTIASSLSPGGQGSNTSATGLSPVLTSSEGVKLTIKPLPEPPKLPKLTIKTTGLGTIAETSDAALVSSTSNSFSPKLLPSVGGGGGSGEGTSGEKLPPHLMAIVAGSSGQQQQPASPSDQHSSISSSSIPKLTIKPLPPKGTPGQTEQNHERFVDPGSLSNAPVECTVVPKLTIKPILPPAKQSACGEDSSSSSETSINSLESSPVSSSSVSSVAASAAVTTSPTAALKMTIKVPSSAPQQHYENSLAGLSAGGSALSGVLTSSSPAGVPVPASTGVLRLNIKPILKPVAGEQQQQQSDPNQQEDGHEHLQGHKDTLTTTSDEGDSTPPSSEESHRPIVIPKVTIKTLAHPRGQETEILSTPKVTLKPIPKPSLDGMSGAPGSPLERHPQQQHPTMGSPGLTNNSTGHSLSNSGGPSDVSESPRIILKINKGSSSIKTTGLDPSETAGTDSSGALPFAQPSTGCSILANELKRPAPDAATGSSSSSSSGSSSSMSSSCASSTSVSVSGTSSSAGSDPASPSSGGGGDQGDPGSPEAKKSKLDLTQKSLARQMGAMDQHSNILRQSILQMRPSASGAPIANNVTDVIVIDDDSKSENEAPKEGDSGSGSARISRKMPPNTVLDPLAVNDLQHQLYPATGHVGSGTPGTKSRRTRGSARGASGSRQSRRGAGRGAASTNVKQQIAANSVVMPHLLGLLEQDDHEDGSSSDCMIVDEPAATTTKGGGASSSSAVHGNLTLENLLRGGSKVAPSPVASSGTGSSNFYGVSTTGPGGPGSSEVDKNGTASNSSIGSITSSISGSIPPAASTPVPSGHRTPTAGVRMSTRRAAGQLLKEVLASKHQDRDSGVDEARTDGEGATPSKRPRGRPKKQSVDLTMETNGGGSSSSVDGTSDAVSNDMLLAMAVMGMEGGSSLLSRPEGGRGLLGPHLMMDGIMPLPSSPTGRTPRTRGRGRGRGRAGKLARGAESAAGESAGAEDDDVFGESPTKFTLPDESGAGGNPDPLFIGAPNSNDPNATTDLSNFHLLFNHVRTPRGGAGGRTRGGRRGARTSRTPRGTGRGAGKAAIAAALLAASESMEPGMVGSFSELASPVAGINQLLDPLLQQQQQLLSSVTPGISPKARGRGRGSRGVGTGTSPNKRRSTRGAGPKSARARKMAAALEQLQQLQSPAMSGVVGELPPSGGTVPVEGQTNNAIFMTPMAGGLDINRPKLHVRELKTPKNAIKSNTPPSSAQATPSGGTTPLGTPGATTPGGASNASGLQVFEEDTRMSGDFNFTTPVRLISSGDGCLLQQNEESQSSYLSSTSVTQDATNLSVANASIGQVDLLLGAPGAVADGTAVVTAAGTAPSEAQKDALAAATSASNSNSSSRKNKGKMEVLDSHRARFTVDLLAEYEWPPPAPGTKGADTFMIQEQIAEFLGVKSFKRKYPDLMRRPVDMEERNFILEKGLASEKMCDLGLTAVFASEILDIMCTDYPEKYEEYTRYTHEKHFRELSNRQRQQQEAISAVAAVPIDRAQLQKDKAIESAANWNCSFNKERRDSRRACMDLQTYVVQVPKRQTTARPDEQQQPVVKQQSSNYPVALVPGQFSEYYTTYTPEELACYPINTILLDPKQLQEIVSSERYQKLLAAEEARLLEADSSSGSSSSSDSDSDDSSSDDSDSSNSSSDDDDADGRSSITSCSGPSDGGASSSDSEGEASGKQKSTIRRRRRNRRETTNRELITDGKPGAVPLPSASTVVIGPVRRSSRTMSAGVSTLTAMVECKELTDSDDSDVPLIAHAVKKKQNLSLATSPATATGPSAGGGKRMQESVTPPIKRPPLNPFMCAVCLNPENKNKYNKPELFVRCNRCRRKAHPSCIGMSSVMYRRVQQYKWQCSECKICMKCKRKPSAIDSKMVYCDQCDRGYHLACKGLRNLPEGRWHCCICTICGMCGAQTPEGHPNPNLSAQQQQQLAMVAEWTHEYGLNELTKIREHLRTLCVPCVRERRQQHQLQPATAQPITVLSSNSENIATLNNNNADYRKPPAVQGMGMGAIGSTSGVISMKPQSSLPLVGGSVIKQ